jgi:hypothetical protein
MEPHGICVARLGDSAAQVDATLVTIKSLITLNIWTRAIHSPKIGASVPKHPAFVND